MASQDPSKKKIAEDSAFEPSIEAWMATADTLRTQIEPVLEDAYAKNRGRPPYPPFGMFKAILCRTRTVSLRQLHRRLRADRRLLRLTGLPRAPSHQAFSLFLNRIGPSRLHQISDLIVKELMKTWKDFGTVLSIDGTVVKAWAKRNRGFLSKTDPDARLGFKEMRANRRPDYVFGYRATVACCTKHELPIAFIVTPANANETRLFPRLLKDAKALGVDFEKVVADKLYDSRLNTDITIAYGAAPIIPINPRSSRSAKQTGTRPHDRILPIPRNSRKWKRYYAKRVAVERLFSSLKEQLGFTALKTRGLANAASYFTLCIIAKLLSAISAVRLGRGDLSRSVLPWSY